MNWKLIFLLSLFGLAMSVATVYWIPSNIEPVFWCVIFIICAIIIARNVSQKYFLHGFMTSLFNCVWITGSQVILFDAYIAHHGGEQTMMASAQLPVSLRTMMLITGPLVGVVSGLVLGGICWVASKVVKNLYKND